MNMNHGAKHQRPLGLTKSVQCLSHFMEHLMLPFSHKDVKPDTEHCPAASWQKMRKHSPDLSVCALVPNHSPPPSREAAVAGSIQNYSCSDTDTSIGNSEVESRNGKRFSCDVGASELPIRKHMDAHA